VKRWAINWYYFLPMKTISRGFIPIETRSTHWVSHPEFSKTIRHYLKFENQHISDYKKELERHLPYRKDDS